jgi:two-component system response regulator AtoC
MTDILVVDDEVNLAYSLRLALERAGYACRTAETLSGGIEEALRKAPDLMIVDMQLPDGDGIELIRRIHDRGLDVPVVVITAYGTISRAVEAMKQGALDFMQKPLSMEEVCLVVERSLENRRVHNELDSYRLAQQRESAQIRIIGECPAMREVLATAESIASMPDEPDGAVVATLVLGETGTGKELLARHMHHCSARATRPFVHVNCTAIPETLFESEMFGHERGTFTDARTAKKGLLEIADGGTILLDEVSDMPATMQAKLLVAIETGRFRRLGGTTERSVDIRVIAATNSDLAARVERGEFRTDLFYRLKMFCVELPPLRARGDDVFLLAEYFLQQYCRKYHLKQARLTAESRVLLGEYAWPGNVRELAHVLRRAVLIARSPELTPESLGLDPSTSAWKRTPEGTRGSEVPGGLCTLAEMERKLIQATLDATGANISEAARRLGLSRGRLRHRLARYGIRLPSEGPTMRKEGA